MTARNQSRLELITYWIRIGDLVSTNAWQTRWIILREGLDGRIPDGILVRASSVLRTDADSGRALEAQRQFLSALYGALSMQGRKTLVGMSPI
jgi:EpsI family protein